MRKKSVLALMAIATFAAAVVVGIGASAAFAGEVTGNCNHAQAGSAAADNCKTDQNANANSICSFSGQNDNPNSTNPENPGGRRSRTGRTLSRVPLIRARRIRATRLILRLLHIRARPATAPGFLSEP